jgi:AcrR family transcriptional regulator
MGRPRAFDEDEVLERALRLFWEQGYEGTSLKDLMAAMQLTKSSLYKAFGSKAALFQRVFSRYEDRHVGFRFDALAETTPARIVAALLHGFVQLYAGVGTPPGCMGTNAALACSPDSDLIRLQVAGGREQFRIVLRDRLIDTAAGAPLPYGMEPDVAASLVQTMIQGLAVQAKSGASKVELDGVVDAFLVTWLSVGGGART